MSYKHWILLNGPPGSGKDTIAKYLEQYSYVKHLKLSAPLKQGLKAFFDLHDEDYKWLESPENKNKHCRNLLGLSWRQIQIDLSEKLVKPCWGEDTFSLLLYQKALITGKPVIVVSDLGFKEELDFISNRGYRSLLVINLERDGCSYKNDSRGIVKLSQGTYAKAKNITIENNGTLQDLFDKISPLMQPYAYLLQGEKPSENV